MDAWPIQGPFSLQLENMGYARNYEGKVITLGPKMQGEPNCASVKESTSNSEATFSSCVQTSTCFMFLAKSSNYIASLHLKLSSIVPEVASNDDKASMPTINTSNPSVLSPRHESPNEMVLFLLRNLNRNKPLKNPKILI